MRVALVATVFAVLVVPAVLAAGCGGALGSVTQPGTAKLELRLIATNEADGFKVPTWDGKASLVVEKRAPLCDRDVEMVKLSKLPDGAPAIDLQFDQTASLTLEDFTSKNIGRRVAILVSGKVVIAPAIKERITGGHMTLAGFNATETADIYAKIKK
jgi:preprotein translocase subunit SecD